MTPALRLLRAEWRKATGNLWIAGCMAGIWPVFALLGMGALLLLGAFSQEIREALAANLFWNNLALGVWDLNSNPLAQIAVLVFAAIVFGGEYRWRTWKNILPRRARVPVLLSKYITLGLLTLTTLLVASVVLTVLGAAMGLALGFAGSYLRMDGALVGQFVARLGARAALAFIGALFVGGAVAIVAILSRSMLIGAVGGFALLAGDGLLPATFTSAAVLTESKLWVELLKLRFMYNLFNVDQILQGHGPTPPAAVLGSVPGLGEYKGGANSLPLSLLIIAAWLVMLVGVSLWFFRRQDMTS